MGLPASMTRPSRPITLSTTSIGILEVAGCGDRLGLAALAWEETLSRRWQMNLAPAHLAKIVQDGRKIDTLRSKARDAHHQKGEGDDHKE